MYVYIKSEPGLWTVGFYGPDKKWNSESDHDSKEQAAERVAYLNGSSAKVKYVDKYPDTEADGYEFCGKCGKMKTI